MASILQRIASHVLQAYTGPPAPPKSSNPDLSGIFATTDLPTHALEQLVKKSGGTWPPSPTFVSSWPAPLRVYHATYELVAPFFPVLESSTSDAENRKTINTMRARIRGLISGDPTLDAPQCSADMKSVLSALQDAEAGCWPGYDGQSMQSAMLGFCACVCFLRHAYRWGVSPVVREAQIETSLFFPLELDEPWFLLQRYFGFTSPGGSLSSLLYFNTRGVDTNFKPFYSSVHGLPEVHQKTANWDARLFLETEYRATDQSLPMYRLIAETISACGSSAGDCPLDALTSLKEANVVFQNTYRFFFENMNDANISHALWLAYLQGYTGWTLPGADSVVISGVSGGQSLTIRTLDAFLGILPAPPATEEALHLPVAQRDWLRSLREVCHSPVAEFWKEMQDELEKMVQKLRLWRMGHMTRMVPYEVVHRPERVFMTAGRSLPPAGEVSDETGMVHHLKEVLQERLTQTV
ncbi:hypothetical protein K438DRAFT_2087047 [Mycena galopus ATCC 62051]|nr:hypothetical protein K438DRAFT_2104330 [Mycena galopus ATCC 62051]KAF8148751.1 hypothetical protein K438DRAFT_2087047 [Mycena galopus ATCC 62051]